LRGWPWNSWRQTRLFSPYRTYLNPIYSLRLDWEVSPQLISKPVNIL